MNNTTTTSAPLPTTLEDLLSEARAELARWKAEGMTEAQLTRRVIDEAKAVNARALQTLKGMDALVARVGKVQEAVAQR